MEQQRQHEAYIEDLQEQLRHMEELLLHSQRLALLGQLTADISHELRNQLTSMLGHIELARQSEQTLQVTSDLQTVETETRRASEMVSNILSFSRTGVQPSPESPVNINQVVQRTLHLCMHRLRSRNIQVIVTLDPALPEIPANSVLLQQALLNLIINAEQALTTDFCMQTQSRQLTVTTWCNPDAVCICIEDNGPGIDPSIRDRIFEPFVTTRPDGTGLGLKIVDTIITAHKALLIVDSVVDQGTAMTIQLPRVSNT